MGAGNKGGAKGRGEEGLRGTGRWECNSMGNLSRKELRCGGKQSDGVYLTSFLAEDGGKEKENKTEDRWGNATQDHPVYEVHFRRRGAPEKASLSLSARGVWSKKSRFIKQPGGGDGRGAREKKNKSERIGIGNQNQGDGKGRTGSSGGVTRKGGRKPRALVGKSLGLGWKGGTLKSVDLLLHGGGRLKKYRKSG